jgi:hypothetical protein
MKRVGPRETMFEIVYVRVSGVPYHGGLNLANGSPVRNVEVNLAERK